MERGRERSLWERRARFPPRHHSGTSLAERLLSLHPAVAPIVTGVYEDEGQHVQGVFPVIAARTPAACGGELYRCAAPAERSGLRGDFQKPQLANRTWAALCAAWLPWTAAPTAATAFRLEKTPDLMVPLLGTAGRTAASVVVLVRHPFHWHFKAPVFANVGTSARCVEDLRARGGECAVLWLDARVFGVSRSKRRRRADGRCAAQARGRVRGPRGGAAPRMGQGRKRVRNSQLQRLLSRPFSTRFG